MSVALRRSWAKDLDAATLYELLKLRVEVFVVEQATPYPELDGRDLLAETRHFWLEGPTARSISTLRLMEEHPGGEKVFRIGRVCTKRTDARPRSHQPAACRPRSPRSVTTPAASTRRPTWRTCTPSTASSATATSSSTTAFRTSRCCAAGARSRPIVTPPRYPFSALVGHDQLRLALVLCAVRPEIGGVLIRGEKGTAKSTAVRGLATVLSAVDDAMRRLVELPIGATEDRVVGSLDLQKVLRDGEHAFSPGLLARAHGGVLYVDEVNLLHDHLVDVLLDAAAMGRVHVERDGVSHSHDARFVLIGTMNPEEGELRPQLLDRFGLTVDVRASRDVDVRVEVIRRGWPSRPTRPASPRATPTRTPTWPAGSPRRAQPVADVVLPDDELRRIAALCAAFDVDGMRADLVVARTAVAHAAWRGARRPSTEGRHPGRRRTGAAAPASARPVRRSGPRPRAARRGDGPGRRQRAGPPNPSPNPSPDPPGGGGHPSRIVRFRMTTPPQGEFGADSRSRARAPVGDLPHQGAGGAGCRRGCARSSVAGPQPDRHGGVGDRRSRRRATACTCSARCWPPRADSNGAGRPPGRRPTTCAARFARAAKAIW